MNNLETPLELESIRYDLHMHTCASDGTLEAEVLADRAVERRLDLIAITDHDTVTGVKRLMQNGAYKTHGLRVIAGVELTALWRNRIVHIVGLNVDVDSVSLATYLDKLALLRRQRAEKIVAKLEKSKIVKLGFLKRLNIADGQSIGRPHIARKMVEDGAVQSEQAAFNKFLGTGKIGDVKMVWPSMAEAIDAIRSAGGVAVIAHPTKYNFTFTKIRELSDDFIKAGGQAIEVSYTGIKSGHQSDLERLARLKGLYVSAGSDFHSPRFGWTEVGKFSPVKDIKQHVLNLILTPSAC